MPRADEPGQVARRAQGEEYEVKALAVTRAARGERHPGTTVRYNNLAVLKAKMGDWPGAAIEMEREVAIMLSLGLSEHANMPTDLAGLALLWSRSGQSVKAARLRNGDLSDLRPVIAQ